MKVVLVDNYARDNISDKLLAENLSTTEAARQALEYNDKHSPHGYYYAVVKEDDYQLFTWEP